MNRLALSRVIGHRGAARLAPENTAAAFRRAAADGAGWVELDVQLSRDGVPVVFHDETLERTTDGRGRLVDTELSELRRLDAGRWFAPAFAGERLLTLEQTIALLLQLGLSVNIEIKADETRAAATAEVALELAGRLWPADRPPPLVSSFSRRALARAAQVVPDWPRGLVSDGWPADWRRATRRLGCASLHVFHPELTPRRVRAAKETGLAVLSYTVNEPALASRLWLWGVDAVFSDDPGLLLVADANPEAGPH